MLDHKIIATSSLASSFPVSPLTVLRTLLLLLNSPYPWRSVGRGGVGWFARGESQYYLFLKIIMISLRDTLISCVACDGFVVSIK